MQQNKKLRRRHLMYSVHMKLIFFMMPFKSRKGKSYMLGFVYIDFETVGKLSSALLDLINKRMENSHKYDEYKEVLKIQKVKLFAFKEISKHRFPRITKDTISFFCDDINKICRYL